MDLIDDKTLRAYKIANQFLRLKRTEVFEIRNAGSIRNETNIIPYSVSERLKDFIYYNDFYIFSTFLILILLYIIFYG